MYCGVCLVGETLSNKGVQQIASALKDVNFLMGRKNLKSQRRPAQADNTAVRPWILVKSGSGDTYVGDLLTSPTDATVLTSNIDVKTSIALVGSVEFIEYPADLYGTDYYIDAGTFV